MDRLRATPARPFRSAWLASLLGLLASAPTWGQGRPSPLRHASFRAAPAEPNGPRAFALRCADGTRVGTWAFTADGVRLAAEGQPELSAPRLQWWMASPDGRTSVGAGDPEAREHPFALEVLVYRDGRRVAALAERLATESELDVGVDGAVALVGHREGERGAPFALVLDAEGRTLFRHTLPAGTLLREPRLFGERLLVRVHGLLTEGADGALFAVDATGARALLEVPGALSLVGFPSVERALVLGRERAVWIDARDGHVLWERALELRPAGAHACELLRSPTGTALGVLTARPQRAGEPPHTPELLLLDARDGSTLGRHELRTAGSPGDVDLRARTDGDRDELVVECSGTVEVLQWND